MTEAHPVSRIVADRQCMGCGMCTLVTRRTPGDRAPSITMQYDSTFDHYVPVVTNWEAGDDPGEFVCPGTEMDMPALAEAVHGREPDDPMLGEVVALRAAYSADATTRSRSASGGVVPTLLAHLLKTNAIDVAYVVRTTEPPGEERGVVVRDASELATVHGSVYHPARFGEGLRALLESRARFAFVGLPCEIAGLEMLKRRHPHLASRHQLSIGLFCGGINTFAGIDYYLSRFGLRLRDLSYIDYRHGRWPGSIRALGADGREHEVRRIVGNTRWNILRYMIGFQGYWMLPRCRLCPDQVADFADIAVGDPHLPRFRSRESEGFSVVVSRTARGEALLAETIATGMLVEEPITRAEVIASQGYTLDNRRHALAYAKVARIFGLKPPRIAVYHALRGGEAARHYRYAVIDIMKLVLPKNGLTRIFYVPWQIFEYLFITLTPTLIARRLMKLFRNTAD